MKISAYTNTRDLIGEQRTFDELVAGTLKELVEDGVPVLGDYALYKNSGLEKVTLPSTMEIGRFSLASCPNLKAVDVAHSGTTTISGSAFNGSGSMADLIVRSTRMSTLSSTNALSNTKIAIGLGGIYVPDNLVDTYKKGTNWSAFANNIYPISAYPVTDFSTIKDNWEQILASEEDGTYKTKYKVGDTKTIDVNGETVYMQIAALDSDELANGSGNAKITWICKNLYTEHRMNASNTTKGGWEVTEMRAWLRDTVLPTLPSNIKNSIKPVNKTYYDHDSSSTKAVEDTIWIPSWREVGFGTNKEDSGPIYSDLFKSNDSRIKYNSTSAPSSWWLRSANNSNSFSGVSGGVSIYYAASSSYGVVFGFCT